MKFRPNAECGNCLEIYKEEDFVTCPNCDQKKDKENKNDS